MIDHREDPLDEVVAAFQNLPVPARPVDSVLLAGLSTPMTRSDSPQSWRSFLMRPAVRYSSVAALILVAAGWLVSGPSVTPALAQVVQAAEGHRLVRFQSRQTTDDRQNLLTASGTRTVYVDLVEPRVREEEQGLTFNNILDFRYAAVYDYRRDRFLGLLSQEQVMTRDQAPDDFQRQIVQMAEDKKLAKKEAVLSRVARTKTDDIPPMSLLGRERGFLQSLRELQASKETLATRATLDGKNVAKYRLREGNRTVSLWVDPATKLPIRVEIEILDPTPRIARNEWVYTGFEWDPRGADLDGLFRLTPPAGYAVEDHTGEP